MRQFEKLRATRTFRRQHADFFDTLEDHHLIGEIGFHQAKGTPLTLKQLFLLDIGSISTVQRRLRKLKARGLVAHAPAAGDRRAVELTLSPKCVEIFANYDVLMSSKSAARPAARRSGEPKHVCGLCDTDEGGRSLLVAFLAQGLKRGDRCVLIAPAELHAGVLSALHRRQKAPEQIVVTEGNRTANAQFAFFARLLQEAKRAGQGICLAANMAWTSSKNLRIDAMLDIETRLDAIAGKHPFSALCVYDARRFSSGEFLRAVKRHRDHARHPVLLG